MHFEIWKFLTICDGFFSDARSILPVPFLIKFNTAFAIRCAVDAKHRKIAHVYAKLFDRTAPTRLFRISATSITDQALLPESVTGCNEHSHAILDEPETDF